MAAYSRYCRDHSVPTPSRMDIAILSTQARNLLAGGYLEADITEEALTVASEFDLYFGHKGMTQLQRRVQVRYEKQRLAEHEARKAEERVAPLDPEAQAAAQAFLAARKSPPRPAVVVPAMPPEPPTPQPTWTDEETPNLTAIGLRVPS